MGEERRRRGKVFGSSSGYTLPDGSTLSPDAAWISNELLDKLSRSEKRHFPPLTPNFGVEVKSPSDSIREQRAKCRQWIANGAELAWLIDGDAKVAWQYFDGDELLHENAEELAGRGPVEGVRIGLTTDLAGDLIRQKPEAPNGRSRPVLEKVLSQHLIVAFEKTARMRAVQGVLPRLEAEDQIVMHKDPQCARKQFDELVRQNPDLRIELQGDGRIIVTAPAGLESNYESTEVGMQLGAWAKQDGRGKVFGSSSGYTLPDGSTLSPDAAWISNELLDKLSRSEKRHFPPLTPNFVVEVKSPSDSIREQRAKCRQWIANGAELAWLIDGDAKVVWEYFDGDELLHENAEELAGNGPVEGFVLDLRPIWQGI